MGQLLIFSKCTMVQMTMRRVFVKDKHEARETIMQACEY